MSKPDLSLSGRSPSPPPATVLNLHTPVSPSPTQPLPFPPLPPLDSPIRRKPLPLSSSSRPTSSRSGEWPLLSETDRKPSHGSLFDAYDPHFSDEPLYYPRPAPFDFRAQDSPTLPPSVGLDSRLSGSYHYDYRRSRESYSPKTTARPTSRATTARSSVYDAPRHARTNTDAESYYMRNSIYSNEDKSQRPPSQLIAPMAAKIQPNIALPDGDGYNNTEYLHSPDVDEAPSKSPNRFTSFFRWGSTGEQGNALASHPPLPDHPSPSLSPKTSFAKNSLPLIDISRANALDDGVSELTNTPYSVLSINELEEEVKIVSADLAASIRREMELEDLVERLQAEATERGTTEGRRTSDYFSDAGTPVRMLDYVESKPDALTERIQRKAEQDMAQLRLELLGKVQEEREKRKVVEQHVKELEEQVAQSAQNSSSLDAPERVRNLENVIEDAKRKLVEERQMKENFEDLLRALREELEANKNERDNLRDEIVPQLRARVEGLESEASDLRKLTYEHSRMQQELINLKNENASLAAALMKNQHHERQQQSVPASPIFSPSETTSAPALPLNVKDRESLAEKLKDVEAQRDALHKALKSLRDRQQYENNKSRERISQLEAERDEALNPSTKRKGRDKEISALRREVDRLRQRAEDALEQKFVCERSLGTLQMDLQRAEQETATLRVLLQAHDNLIGEHEELRDAHARLSREASELKQNLGVVSSASLQQAYKDLKQVHERSLSRIDELESQSAGGATEVSEREQILLEANETSQKAIEDLRKSLTETQLNLDMAQVEADAYRKRAESLQKSEKQHLEEERALSIQLRISSERVEELAVQVRAQIGSNDRLRERLADCIARGEKEQEVAAKKINDLQEKLKVLEDKVLEAQQKADDAVTRHEEDRRKLKETHTSQLRRLKSTMVSSATSPRMPTSPFMPSPKLGWVVRRNSDSDTSKTAFLESKVKDLENALREADNEMAEVVSKMNVAQIEVMELQTERDEVLRQTRRLHAELIAEKAKYAKA